MPTQSSTLSDTEPQNLSLKTSPATDSPWLWLMLFSCFGLVMLFVMEPKFNARQRDLDHEYQGRMYMLKRQTVERNPGVAPTFPLENRATSENTVRPVHEDYGIQNRLIQLTPLKILMLCVMGSSWVMFCRERLRVFRSVNLES